MLYLLTLLELLLALALRLSALILPLALAHPLVLDLCAFDYVFPCVTLARLPLICLPLVRLPLWDSCASDYVFLFLSPLLVLSQYVLLVLPRGPYSLLPFLPPSPVSLIWSIFELWLYR